MYLSFYKYHTREKMKNFYALFEKMRTISFKNSKDIEKDLFYLASYGNTISLSDVLLHISSLSRIFITNISSSNCVSADDTEISGGFDVYISKTGRFIVYKDDLNDYELDKENLFFIGSILLNESANDLIRDQYQEIKHKEKFYLQIIDQQINLWYSTNQFSHICNKIQNDLQHIASLFIHIENHSYIKANLTKTTLELWDNISSTNLFQNLTDKSINELSYNEKLLTVALMCMESSGNMNNIEELNGLNMTPSMLFDLILQRYIAYVSDININEFYDLLIKKGIVSVCYKIGESLLNNEENIFRYRRINGITFNKKEYSLSAIPQKLVIPNKIIELCTAIGVKYKEDDSFILELLKKLYELETSGVPVNSVNPTISRSINWLEYILYIIVEWAKKELNCEFTLISGIKDISMLVKLKHADNLLSIQPEDMFCLINDWSQVWCPEVSIGMQYNRWKFIGGIISDLLPDNNDRDFRIPLIVPDNSYNNVYHHDGHERLNIQSVIRFAAPMTEHKAISLNGIKYKALYDIRGFRSINRSFTMQEMKNALNVAELIDNIFKNILNLYIEQNIILKVNGFDSIYYQETSNCKE